MSVPNDKPKTKRLSFTKDELQYIFVALASTRAASIAQLQIQDLPLSQLNERVRPLELLQARVWGALKEFSEGGE